MNPKNVECTKIEKLSHYHNDYGHLCGSSLAISFQVQRTINSTLKLMGTLPSKFLCHDEQIFHRGMKKKTVYCIFNSDNLHYKSVKK